MQPSGLGETEYLQCPAVANAFNAIPAGQKEDGGRALQSSVEVSLVMSSCVVSVGRMCSIKRRRQGRPVIELDCEHLLQGLQRVKKAVKSCSASLHQPFQAQQSLQKVMRLNERYPAEHVRLAARVLPLSWSTCCHDLTSDV